MMKPQIYISFATGDRETASLIARRLEEAGYDVWWDSEYCGMSAAAERAAAAADCVIVAWSYAAASSRWVLKEAQAAASRRALVETVLHPIGAMHHELVEGLREEAPQLDLPPPVSLAEWQGDIAAPEWKLLMERIRQACGRPTGKLPMREQLAPALWTGVAVAASAVMMEFISPVRPPLPGPASADTLAEAPAAPSAEADSAMGGPVAPAREPASAPRERPPVKLTPIVTFTFDPVDSAPQPFVQDLQAPLLSDVPLTQPERRESFWRSL